MECYRPRVRPLDSWQNNYHHQAGASKAVHHNYHLAKYPYICREKELSPLAMTKAKPIDWNFSITTDLIHFDIEPSEGNDFILQKKEGRIHLVSPRKKFTTDEYFQKWLRTVVREILRKEAHRLFPTIVRHWAEQTGLTYQQLHIHQTKSKWGSFSGLGNINLSTYLMLMDRKYIDYTVCHELCHSREMNHSPRFWQLLNQVTQTDAKQIGREMNNCVKSWYESGDPRYTIISGK